LYTISNCMLSQSPLFLAIFDLIRMRHGHECKHCVCGRMYRSIGQNDVSWFAGRIALHVKSFGRASKVESVACGFEASFWAFTALVSAYAGRRSFFSLIDRQNAFFSLTCRMRQLCCQIVRETASIALVQLLQRCKLHSRPRRSTHS
jgi:hypothetical protein